MFDRDAAVTWKERKLWTSFIQKWGNVVGATPLMCLQTRVLFNPFAQIPPNQFMRSQFHLCCLVGGANAHTQAGHEWSRLLERPIASLPLCSDVPSYLPGHLTLKFCCLWCGDLFVRCTVAALRGQTVCSGGPESLGVEEPWEERYLCSAAHVKHGHQSLQFHKEEVFSFFSVMYFE